jgi:Na+/proline symporter
MWMIIGLSLYFLFVVFVGVIGAKKIKSASDFALAGNSMGPIPLGLAFSASFFSAATFQGYVGFMYAWGQTSLWIFLAIFGASTLGFIAIAKGVREGTENLKVETMADWLATSYKSDVLRCIVAVTFLLQIFYVAGQFSAGASVISGMIDGVSYKTALYGLAIVTALYVTLGGLFADVYTSIGQMTIMMFCGVFIFFSGWAVFSGGLTEASVTIAAENPYFIAVTNPNSLHMYSYATIFGVLFVEFAFAGQPQLLNKIMALKNPKDMRKMIITWMVAAFCCLLVMFGGVYMRALNPALANADSALIEYSKLFHPVISMLISVAIIAALMSTACGLTIVMTTCLATDVFKKTLVHHGIIKMSAEKAEKVTFTLTRIFPSILVAISLYLVLNPPAFMGVMVWIGISGVASATLAPLMVAILFPQFKSVTAAICAAVCGLAFYIYAYLISGMEKSVMAAGAWGVIVSFVVMFGVGYFTSAKKTPSTI